MNCQRARELLWPLDRPHEVDGAVEEARAHLASCADCAAFFARDAELGRALRRISLAVEAPEALKARVLAAVEAEPAVFAASGVGRRALRWLAAAAAIVLAALGIGRLGLGVSTAEASYIADYRAHAEETVPAESMDLERTEQLFERTFGVRFAPLTYDAGVPSRAMICPVDGRRVGHIDYELEGHTVSHYRVPVSGAGAESDLTSATRDGICVVRWSDGEFEHALVSDMSEDRLRRIARERFAASD